MHGRSRVFLVTLVVLGVAAVVVELVRAGDAAMFTDEVARSRARGRAAAEGT